MMNLGFLLKFRDKLEKVDPETMKQYVKSLIDEFDNIKTIFDSISEGMLVLDTDQSIVYYNKMAETLFQVKNNKAIGKKLTAVTSNKPLVDVITGILASETTTAGSASRNYRMERGSKDTIYLNIRVEPLVRRGVIEGTIIIMVDNTRSWEQENRLRQSESLAALTTMAAGIAHEIKNPLGAMGIHVQLVERELNQSSIPVSRDMTDSIHAIKEEIDRLNGIVVDFLYTVRPLQTELTLVNVQEFLDSFCEFIRPQLTEHDIALVQNYSDIASVWMDQKYMQHALLNLVQNSLGAIVESGTIEIEAFIDKQYLYINIIDNGPGIPEEVQAKIFDPYFTTKNFGTGLGLTIVYKIIKEHKGQLTFSSNPGQTIFTVQLPAHNSKKDLLEYRSETYGD
jgi:two-component system, sporulation sensor kinase E